MPLACYGQSFPISVSLPRFLANPSCSNPIRFPHRRYLMTRTKQDVVGLLRLQLLQPPAFAARIPPHHTTSSSIKQLFLQVYARTKQALPSKPVEALLLTQSRPSLLSMIHPTLPGYQQAAWLQFSTRIDAYPSHWLLAHIIIIICNLLE